MVHLRKADGAVEVFPQTPSALYWPGKPRLRPLETQWESYRRTDFDIPTDSFMRRIPGFPNFLTSVFYLGGKGAKSLGCWTDHPHDFVALLSHRPHL